jgi:ATP-binding cassette subfamily F protein 3
MLQVNHIRLSYGPRLILDDISFTVAPGEKAGLIGVNGAGKSSLLKIIGGYQDSDRGSIMRPRTFGYLSQDVAHETPIASGSTARDFIFSATGLDAAVKRYEELSIEIATVEGEELEVLLERFEQAQNALEHLGYYDADARCEQLIAGLNIGGVTLDREVSTLSRTEDKARARASPLPGSRTATARRANELPGRRGITLADGVPGDLSWYPAHHLP